MKKLLSMLLAVLMVVGMFPMTAFAADATIPDGLGILALSDAEAFEESAVLNYSKWGMEGYSAPSWIVTVPAGTETVKVTFDPSSVPTWGGNISGGWITYDAENDSYSMGGKDLAYEESNGGYTITLDVKSMIENNNYYVKYNSYYAEEYALGFKYGEAAPEITGPVITLSTDAESVEIGDKFAVTATLSGNEGFNAITLKLNWNDSAVEFTGFDVIEEDGEEYLDSDLANVRNMTVEFNNDKGIVTAAKTSDTAMNGTLFVANFEVIGNGEAEISLKKDFPDFVFGNEAGTEVSVHFDETDVEALGQTIPATAISLNNTEVSIEEGGSYLLLATVEPSDTTDAIVFTSSDESVATVSDIGKIEAIKPGTATITATAGAVSAECVVTVNPEENIIRTSETGYSGYADSEMTGVKSIQIGGETLEIRNLYKVTLQGHEETYLHNSKAGFSSTHAGYRLDGTHAFGDTTWGSSMERVYINGSYGYRTKEYLVSYDDLKAAVGEENMCKLGVSEDDTLAVMVFKKVSANFNYVVLFKIEHVEVTGISISEKLDINVGETSTLSVTWTPDGAEGKAIWSSSDESVATVDENGVVTGIKNGTATITATYGEFSDTCEVTVRTSIKNIPSNGDRSGNVTGIYVSGVEVDGYEWEDKTLTVYVDQNTNATATVTFDWFYRYNQRTSNSYEVEVTNGEGYLDEFREYGDWVVKFVPTVPTTVLTVESEATVVKGYEITLNANRNEGATDIITWTSSDESVATVSQNGVVKGISEGKATITVKSGDLEATCEVSVILVHAESVTIVGEGVEDGKLRITKGTQIQLSEVAEPAEHTDEVTWSTSNNEVLSILEWAPGYFNAKAPGTATVTVTVGNVSDSIEVEVYEAPAEKITLDKTEATILTIETIVLKATVEPENHTDGNIEWSSSDESVATVSNGTVTPVAVGEATITAKVGNVSATCKVIVKEPEEGTVIWEYDGNTMNGWPQHVASSYGIGALVMNGAKYESVTNEGDVYTVTLPHATAKDAEISLKAFACGYYPNQLGVNWNDDPENKLEYTFNLAEGEASVKIRAYKASGAGASREGTKTFKFVVGGEHNYDQQVATEEHLASAATCEAAATYYMSCVCGENGTETFTHGDALDHDYEGAVTTEATCCAEGVMTYTCANCGDSYTEAIAIDPEAHKVSEEWTSADGKHYHVCENGCGSKFDEDECSGGEATCCAKAVCEICGGEYGEVDSDKHNLHYETVTEPTCETAGLRKLLCQNGCGYELEEEIPALGHDWSAWTVVKEATFSENGLKERVCENCGEKETQLIPRKRLPSRDEDEDKDSGRKEEESNPSTGAPVFDLTAAGVVVLAAAAAVLEIKRRK